MVLRKVRHTIQHQAMFAPGDRAIVAVSGGPDSVCLLSVLQELAPELGITLQAAHLDHRFRGAGSAEDARFVAGLAERLGVPAVVEGVDVPAFCRERGLSAQDGARKVRYGFLQQVARDRGASRIATGHTAEDQAETFLMRLLRGAGAGGLSGIPPVNGAVVRPLIEVTREEVLRYLAERGLAYRTDPSNNSAAYTRNRVRQELLPILKQFNPRIVEVLAREAALLRDEDRAVEAHLDDIEEAAVIDGNGMLAVRRDRFDALPTAFQRRLLRRLLERQWPDRSLSCTQTDETLAFLLTAQTGRSHAIGPEQRVSREYDRLLFGRPQGESGFCRDLALPGTTAIPELGLVAETAVAAAGTDLQGGANYRWQAQFDYAKIAPRLTLRSRRPGDWFCPAGMAGNRKKIQDFLVDEKIPRRLRDRVALLCCGDDILWVVGQRIDGRFAAEPEAKQLLIVTIRDAGQDPAT